jgi:hypothetical protein
MILVSCAQPICSLEGGIGAGRSAGFSLVVGVKLVESDDVLDTRVVTRV